MTDLIFLRSLLENPVMHKIVRAHDKLDPSQQQSSSLSFQNQSGSIRNRSAASSSRPVPSHHDLSGLSASVANDLERLSGYYKDASFLYKLLRCPEFIVSMLCFFRSYANLPKKAGTGKKRLRR